MSDEKPKILVVDDVPENVRLLEAVLVPRGYDVVTAPDGASALALVESEHPDLVLLDVFMPELDGYSVCTRLRENEETAVLPVIMVTSSVGEEKTRAIEAGADDFIPKPFNHQELLTRVRSLLRIKRYHDTIKRQAVELRDLNRTLEERVQSQVDELERLRRLGRFLSPQVVEAIVSSGNESILRSHRREVAVFFADLRGWTNFVDGVEPEELLRVLAEFHETIGGLVERFEATVDFSRATASSSFSTIRSRSRTPRFGLCGSAARCARKWSDSPRAGASGAMRSTSVLASPWDTQPAARWASKDGPTMPRSEASQISLHGSQTRPSEDRC